MGLWEPLIHSQLIRSRGNVSETHLGSLSHHVAAAVTSVVSNSVQPHR